MEDRVDIPESFWERLVADKRKLAYVVGGALLVVALIVFGVVRAVGDRSADSDRIWNDPGSGSGSGSQDTSPSTEQTRSAEETAAGTDGDAGEPKEGSGAGREFTRAAVIAYRKDGALWTADEKGSGAKKLASARAGAFALSPDGKTLAYVDPSTGVLVLVPVAGGDAIKAGPALDADLAWAPDSSAIAYSARSGSANQVRTVKRDGSGGVLVGSGHSPRYSPDALALAWIADAPLGQAGRVVVQRIGSADPPSRSPDLVATEVAFGLDGVVAVVTDSSGASSIMAEELGPEFAFAPSARARKLPITVSPDKPASLAHLCADPTGRYLSYTASGDDGYSRVSVYDSERDTTVALSVRRDTYPMCWSADGRRVFVVEGNAFQGEPTTVLSVLPDGMGRAAVVEGGGL